VRAGRAEQPRHANKSGSRRRAAGAHRRNSLSGGTPLSSGMATVMRRLWCRSLRARAGRARLSAPRRPGRATCNTGGRPAHAPNLQTPHTCPGKEARMLCMSTQAGPLRHALAGPSLQHQAFGGEEASLRGAAKSSACRPFARQGACLRTRAGLQVGSSAHEALTGACANPLSLTAGCLGF